MWNGFLWFEWQLVKGVKCSPYLSVRIRVTFTNEAEHWTRQDNGAARAKPLVVNGVVVGPFEEKEEGSGLASDGARGKQRGFSPAAAAFHS